MTVAGRVGLIAIVGLLVGVLTQIGQGSCPMTSPRRRTRSRRGSWSPSGRDHACPTGVGPPSPGSGSWSLPCPATTAWSSCATATAARYRRWYFGGRAQLVGGPVFGVAGWTWRFEAGWRRAAAIGLLAAVAIAEGAYLTRILPDVSIGAGFVVVGLCVPVVLGRSAGERGRAYLAVVPAFALGALGYIVFLWLATLTSML